MDVFAYVLLDNHYHILLRTNRPNLSKAMQLARHNVSPDEVEDVAFEDEPWIRKGRKKRRYMLGYTIAGRYLFIVYVPRLKGTARVITAMDMDQKTKRLYRRRGK